MSDVGMEPEWDFAAQEKQDEARKKKAGGIAHFYWKPKKDEDASKQEGRPVFAPAERVKIIIPGQRDEIDTWVQDKHRETYPREYQAFLARKDQDAATGTLLTAWGRLTPERCEEYAVMKVRTVEQLASIPDLNLARFGPGTRKEQRWAKEYVEYAKGHAPIARLQAESDAKDQRIQVLEQQVAQLMAALPEGAKLAPLPLPRPVEMPPVAAAAPEEAAPAKGPATPVGKPKKAKKKE